MSRRSWELTFGGACGAVLLFAGLFGHDQSATLLGVFILGLFMGKLEGPQ